MTRGFWHDTSVGLGSLGLMRHEQVGPMKRQWIGQDHRANVMVKIGPDDEAISAIRFVFSKNKKHQQTPANGPQHLKSKRRAVNGFGSSGDAMSWTGLGS